MVDITVDLADYDVADLIANWAILGTWALSPISNSNPNADMNIQGAGCLIGRISGIGTENFTHASNAGLDLSTGKHIYFWLKNIAWPSTDTKANGGLRVTISSDATPTIVGSAPNDGLSNGKGWFVGGSDTDFTTGWVCYVLNPSSTADVTQGTPVLTSVKRIGMGGRTTKAVGGGSFKPATIIIDAIRTGTGVTLINGTSIIPHTFADIFAQDSITTNSWGILTQQQGIYYCAGKFNFGTTGQTAITYFKDIGQVLVFQNFKVSTTFYELILNGAGSFGTTVQLGNISGSVTSGGCIIKGSGTSVWTLTASAANQTLKLYNCIFSQMKSAALSSTSVVNGCVFSDCGEITASGASITNCSFQAMRTATPMNALYQIRVTTTPTLTSNTFTNCATAILWNLNADTSGKLDGCSFTSGGTGYAIELGTNTPSVITLNNVIFSGYGTSGTTNAAIYNNSGKAITINITGSGTSPTTNNGSGASTIVNAGSVSATLTVQNVSGSKLQSAQVLVLADGGPMPSGATVTITNSGTTATVTHTAHGMATNDYVQITGASLQANNGVYLITKINDNSYSYTMLSTPGSNPTGTILATYAALFGTTDVNGQITMSRVFSSSQPITGRVRLASVAPYYQTSTVTGTINNTTGFTATILMILDQ